MKTLEYRVNFISTIVPTMAYSLGYLVFLNVILAKIPNVAGWSYSQMLLFFALEQLSYYLSWFSFRTSLDFFCQSVKEGSFDFTLKLPANTRFVVTTKDPSLDIFFPVFLPIFLLVYSLLQSHVTVGGLLIGGLLFILGFVTYYNIFFAVAALAFWFTETVEAVGLVDELQTFSRYPKEVYPGPLSFILLTVFPALLFVYVPVSAFYSMINWQFIILSIVVNGISFIVSQKIWHLGLKHYSSASS